VDIYFRYNYEKASRMYYGLIVYGLVQHTCIQKSGKYNVNNSPHNN